MAPTRAAPEVRTKVTWKGLQEAGRVLELCPEAAEAAQGGREGSCVSGFRCWRTWRGCNRERADGRAGKRPCEPRACPAGQWPAAGHSGEAWGSPSPRGPDSEKPETREPFPAQETAAGLRLAHRSFSNVMNP